MQDNESSSDTDGSLEANKNLQTNVKYKSTNALKIRQFSIINNLHMDKVKSKDISIKKFLANLASIMLMTLCSSCNIALQNMYKTISNRGEVTKEKIFKKKELTHLNVLAKIKDLQDLRGRALLTAKPTSAVNMRMYANEEQMAKAKIMNEFVYQVDLVHEICNVGVKLIQIGHFSYRQYKKSVLVTIR
ncbi:hypothetical protein Glove_92g43 [Diversispora epigaea]|uniref:Uncharacterized protein n=1 Tax=Diversispora epigaea TaxID=1348612 RepID=A0A397JES7_9GLOM|nr:hypothetical protein Glove_92g43 [Diversispora epigaea]